MTSSIQWLVLGMASLAAGCVAVPNRDGAPVQFSEEISIAEFEELPSTMQYKVKLLGALDPVKPLEGDIATQTLSLFGREDLIAQISRDYRATDCTPLPRETDPLKEIVQYADQTSIVIINESHEHSRDRAFTAQLAARLRPLGYETLAMEALSNSLPESSEEDLPAFVRKPELPYLQDDDGFYLSEATFGRLGREAKRLGYNLLPYEATDDGGFGPDASRDERIAFREEQQADNLANFLTTNPGSKLLVHVGYSHAMEVPRADGVRWMAAHLKEKTGIDPLTVSQTTCRGGGKEARLAQLPNDEIPGTFDLVIDHPLDRYAQNRPIWRTELGDVATTIPHFLRPESGWRIIEARPIGEPSISVPLDRVAIRPNEDVALMLPPGRYQLRVIDVPPAEDVDEG